MATLRSPGVSLTEIDLSSTPQIAAPIGPVFIGTTPNGPAFEPIVVNSYNNEYLPIFGGLNTNHYLPYAVKNYLENGSNAMVVRVAGYGSTTPSFDAGYVIPASATWVDIKADATGLVATTSSLSGIIPLAVLRKRAGSPAVVSGVTATTIAGELKWTITVAGDVATTFQFTPSTIERYFSRDPLVSPASPSCTGLYLDILYYSQAKNGAADSNPTLSDPVYSSFTGSAVSLSAQVGAYSVASTPWVVGAPNVAGTVSRLFKFYTLQAGLFSNNQCKISIDNIRRKTDALGNAYFEFDVLVRKITDSDKNGQIIFERFTGCNLIPTSQNYIVKKIGDLSKTFDTTYNAIVVGGDWPNNSKYVRVEVASSIDMGARPSGFEPLYSTFMVGSSLTAYPQRNIKVNQSSGSSKYNSKMFFGFEGDGYGIESVSQAYNDSNSIACKGILLYDRGALGISSSADECGGVTGSLQNSYHILPIYPSESIFTNSVSTGIIAGGLDFKFTIPLFGGHDGYKRSLNAQSLITALSAEFGSITKLLKNADYYDFDLVMIPGTDASIPAHSTIIENGIDLCEERGDAFYIADLFKQTVDNPEEPNNTSVESFDTNYAATYWPWYQVWDPENKDYVWNPPSVLAVERYAYNDRVGWKWDAVAGYAVGIGKNVERLKHQLTQDQRDTLYDSRINPIAAFKDTPAILWGQKTLQKTATALDRISVRRLLIAAKRPIKIIGMKNLFKGNTPDIWRKTSDQINVILSDMKVKNGIEEFGVIIDATTNTPDRRDRNEMYGKIFITPVKTIEKVYFDFIITNSGVSFNGI